MQAYDYDYDVIRDSDVSDTESEEEKPLYQEERDLMKKLVKPRNIRRRCCYDVDDVREMSEFMVLYVMLYLDGLIEARMSLDESLNVHVIRKCCHKRLDELRGVI